MEFKLNMLRVAILLWVLSVIFLFLSTILYDPTVPLYAQAQLQVAVYYVSLACAGMGSILLFWAMVHRRRAI